MKGNQGENVASKGRHKKKTSLAGRAAAKEEKSKTEKTMQNPQNPEKSRKKIFCANEGQKTIIEL